MTLPGCVGLRRRFDWADGATPSVMFIDWKPSARSAFLQFHDSLRTSSLHSKRERSGGPGGLSDGNVTELAADFKQGFRRLGVRLVGFPILAVATEDGSPSLGSDPPWFWASAGPAPPPFVPALPIVGQPPRSRSRNMSDAPSEKPKRRP